MTVDTDVPAGFTADRIGRLGLIKVQFCRAEAVKRQEPFVENGARPEALDEVPEKALKGAELKINTKYVRERQSDFSLTKIGTALMKGPRFLLFGTTTMYPSMMR
jgi:hypothetical protein